MMHKGEEADAIIQHFLSTEQIISAIQKTVFISRI